MKSDNLLRRGMFVIENLSALGSLSTEQLSAKSGIPKSSVYRILRILEDFNYVSRSKLEREDTWTLDLKFLTLSANILSRVDLKTEIRDILVKLADDTKEIVQLAMWRNGKVVIVDNVKKHSSLVSVAHEGTSLCINSCTAGLVFGAHMDPEELQSVLEASDLPALTRYTITDPAELRKLFDPGAGERLRAGRSVLCDRSPLHRRPGFRLHGEDRGGDQHLGPPADDYRRQDRGAGGTGHEQGRRGIPADGLRCPSPA